MSLLSDRQWTSLREEPSVGQELRLRHYNLRIVQLLSSCQQCRENQLKVFEALNTENGDRYVLKVTQPINLSLKEVDRLTEVRKWVRFKATPAVDDFTPGIQQIHEVEKKPTGSQANGISETVMSDVPALADAPAPLLVQRMWMQEALVQRFLAQRYSSAGQLPVAPSVRESRWLKMARNVQDSGSFRQSLFVLMDKVPGLAVIEYASVKMKAGERCMSWLPAVLEQCIVAVSRIHDAGVVHGDLRVAHMFAVEPRRPPEGGALHVMVIDYGLSRFAKLEENLYLDRMQSGFGSFFLSSMDPATGMPTTATDWISLCGVFRDLLSHCMRYASGSKQHSAEAGSDFLKTFYEAFDDLFMAYSHGSSLATAQYLRSLLAKLLPAKLTSF
jgi:serine/threonine protein kinase